MKVSDSNSRYFELLLNIANFFCCLDMLHPQVQERGTEAPRSALLLERS
jgi:hypothetical protein